MTKKRTSIRSVVIMAVLAMISALLFNVSPAGSQDGDGSDEPSAEPGDDGSGDGFVADAAPTGPDGHEEAAAANSAAEYAAAEAAPEAEGDPIVPQSPGVPTIVTEPDDNSDPDAAVLDSQPAEGGTVEIQYADPAPGTSATISFSDAGSVADLLAADVTLTEAVQEEIDTAKRSRVVSVSAADLNADLAAENLTVELFPDVSLEMVTHVAPSPGQMGSTVSSSVPADGADGNPFGIVTVIEDRVYGGWWHGNSAYEMIPLGNGDHLLFEVGKQLDGDPEHWDTPAGPDNGPSGLTGAELGFSESDIAADLGADPISFPNVDVLVGIDAEALTALGSSQAAIDLAILNVNLTNMTYLNSGAEAPQNMTLVSVYETGYTPANNDGVQYRNELANKVDGTFDAIHNVRDSNFADLVVVIFNRTMFAGSTSLCGIAFFPTSANPAENDAYQITRRSCATTTALTFPHEFGHNQCAGHDVTGGGCSVYTVDNGYVDASTSQRTIMARNSNTCCVRRPVWSNPSITWNGWTPGTASTDNNFVLEQEDRAPGTVSGGVADYRVNPLGDAAVAGNDGVSCIYNTIEDAIAFTPPGGTIYIAPGTYPAQSSGFNYNVGKDLDFEQGTALCEPTVSGAASNVVLQLAAGSTVDAVFEVFGGATVRAERITFQGGNSAEGTVFVSGGADLTLDAAVVENGNNPSTTVGGGGVRIDGATSSVTSINNSLIRNNGATFGGGGVFVDDGSFTMNGTDDVINNIAADGGGVYATDTATVTLLNNADIFSNTANDDGGGVYLDNSTLSATGIGTLVSSNNATAGANGVGGGIFGTNGSTVTIGGFATVGSNAADFGGGVYMLGVGSEVQIDDNGTVTSNTSSSNGAGVLVTQSALADLNAGSSVVNNSASGFGGGVAVFTPASLDADGGAGSVDPVLIDNNSAVSNGGGIWVTGTANLDTVHIEDNDAANGGGLWVGGTANVTEGFGCAGGAADVGFERYCNEFSRNTATGTGSAVSVAGGTLFVEQTGFLANSGGRANVFADGAADVDIFSSMFLNNIGNAGGDGHVTVEDTTNLNVIGVTFAGNNERALDVDVFSGAVNVSRVISDSGTWALGAGATGSCNLRTPGSSGNLPGNVIADPRFETNDDTDYMPAPRGPAADACNLLGGTGQDAFDSPAKDADGVASSTEFDMGGVEADRQPLVTPRFAIQFEGDSGTSIMNVPVDMDLVSSDTITIDWQTVDNGVPGVATANVDYIAASGTLTFLPGSTQEFIPLTIIGDTTPEANLFLGEWILIAFSNISEEAEFDNFSFFGIGVGVITNDDGPPP